MSLSVRALYLGTDDTGSSHDAADESGEHTVLAKTTRLARFELEAVLQASASASRATDSGANDNDDAESTLAVTAEENRLLLANAFRSTDDEITLEAPVPSLPDDVPSPLGDGDERSPELPPLAPSLLADDSGPGDEPVCAVPLLTPEALASRISGITRPSVTHEEASAIRSAREASRAVREEEAKTRVIVLGIWGAAVTLSALLAFFALTT